MATLLAPTGGDEESLYEAPAPTQANLQCQSPPQRDHHMVSPTRSDLADFSRQSHSDAEPLFSQQSPPSRGCDDAFHMLMGGFSQPRGRDEESRAHRHSGTRGVVEVSLSDVEDEPTSQKPAKGLSETEDDAISVDSLAGIPDRGVALTSIDDGLQTDEDADPGTAEAQVSDTASPADSWVHQTALKDWCVASRWFALRDRVWGGGYVRAWRV